MQACLNSGRNIGIVAVPSSDVGEQLIDLQPDLEPDTGLIDLRNHLGSSASEARLEGCSTRLELRAWLKTNILGPLNLYQFLD